MKKISIDGGFTCPNKDGTKGWGGCIFCNEQSYTPRHSIKGNIIESIKNQIKYSHCKYIAYFQTNTNTYKQELLKIFNLALSSSPLIIGLNIGTRADCIQDHVIELIIEFSKKTYLTIDIGIESIYDQTLKKTNRGHDYKAVVDTLNVLNNLKKDHNINFDICGHIIIGFPWETYDEQMAYVYEINKLPLDHLKINNLQVVANTKLAEIYKENPFYLYSSDEYIDFLANFLSLLSPNIIIQRLMAYCPKDLLIYPKWTISKFDFYQQLDKTMEKNGLFQGSRFNL